MAKFVERSVALTAPPSVGTSPDCARCGAPAAGFIAVEHELRTPLTVLRAVTEILRDCPDLAAADRAQLLAAAIAELDRLDGTVEGLLHPWRSACDCFAPI